MWKYTIWMGVNECDVERDVPVNVDEIIDYFWNIIGINGGRVIFIMIYSNSQ